MSTLVDDLDDEEIEASLLWTDDEDGDHENIDPLDEELLLSEPISVIESTLKKGDACKTNEIVMNSADADENTFEISKLVESEESAVNSCKSPINENLTHLDTSLKLNDTIISSKTHNVEEILETTLTDEFIDLNVTFNTRDALESSIVEDTTSCHDETVCEESHVNAEPNETVCEELIVNAESKMIDNNGNFDCSSMPVPSVSSNECDPSKDQTVDVIHVPTSESSDGVQSSVEVTCAKDGKNHQSDTAVQADLNEESTQNCKPDYCAVDELGEQLSASKAEDNSHLTVIDCFESSSVANMSISQSKTENVNAASANPVDNLNDTKHDPIGCHDAVSAKSTSPTKHDAVSSKNTSPTKDYTIGCHDALSAKSTSPSIDDAIKSIRQAVSKTKRTERSLSDEQEPALKRFRHSSEPVTISSVVNNKETKPVENNKSSTPNTLSPDTPESEIKKGIVEVNKKKSIVTFDFQHYCKEASTNPYVCKTCSMKFKEELKFESHLIASHAMALNISHFNIDLHQYYRQKKEKAISQSKSVLPKLEGIVDQALITEYNQNVKLITAQKNLQYFCKICENIYSTKNLIIEHLKSPKHILRKKV